MLDFRLVVFGEGLLISRAREDGFALVFIILPPLRNMLGCVDAQASGAFATSLRCLRDAGRI